MNWTLHPALKTLRDQVNTRWPQRSKISDGAKGDDAHAARKSDHNPDERGVVHAIDLTHDPAHGLDAGWLAERLRTRRDPRVSYVIWNQRMFSSYPAHGVPAWTWRDYKGDNPHDKHVHISVTDSSQLWTI